MTKPAANGETAARFRPAGLDFANYKPKHFLWSVDGKVATITLEPAGAQEPADVRILCRAARHVPRSASMPRTSRAIVITGAGGNFCSGGDVHEIIGPLVEMQRKDDMAGLLAFTRMTGDLVKAMRACPQPIIAAIDGICAGAGAIMAMASDLRCRHGAQQGRLPVRARRARRRRHGRLRHAAAHHRRTAAPPSCSIPAARWTAPRPSAGASTTSSCEPEHVLAEAQAMAKSLADGPTFAQRA